MLRNPLVRFLLRALGWLAVALALWWMVMLDPLLGGLRIATETVLRLLPGDRTAAHATIGPDGDWMMQLPVPPAIGRLDSTQRIFGRVSKDAPLVKVRSLKILVARKYPILFTVSLPFFWALWVAAPGRGNLLRGLVPGSVLLALGGIFSLVFYAVYLAVDTLHLAAGMAAFLLQASNFAVIDLVPHAAPLLLAVWLHPGLQRLVFSGTVALPEPAQPKRKAARAGRGRYR